MDRLKRWRCDSCNHENRYYTADGLDKCQNEDCQAEVRICDDCENHFATRSFVESGVTVFRCPDCRLAIAAVRKRGMIAPAPVNVRVVAMGESGGSPVKW